MKTHSAILALAVAMSIPSTASAQHARFSVGAGVMVPSGDYWSRPDYFGHPTGVDAVGWQVMGAVEITIPRTRLGLRLDGLYGTIGGADGFNPFSYTLRGGTASLVYHVGAPLAPVGFYLLGGAGYITTGDLGAVYGGPVSNVAYAGGAGLSGSTGPIKVFVELRFITLQTMYGALNIIPVTVGVWHAL
jgi:hypothetical protein